jgi:acyl dehydratase
MGAPGEVHLAGPRGLGRAYLHALLARRPALLPEGRTVPRIEGRRAGLRVRRSALQAYARVCGFTADGRLPATYPHVLAMGLHLAMLTSRAFPVRLLGLVHLANRIAVHRAISEDEPLDLACRLEGHRETESGQEFEMHTEMAASGAPAWSETTTFLARRPGRQARAPAAAPGETPPPGAAATAWQVPADIGLRYARVSGDFNPIHLAAVTARWFGFRRAIAHGMWSLARVVAELAPTLESPALRVEVRFRRPVFLPASVTLHRWPSAGGIAFLLGGPAGGKLHLAGSLRPLAAHGA